MLSWRVVIHQTSVLPAEILTRLVLDRRFPQVNSHRGARVVTGADLASDTVHCYLAPAMDSAHYSRGRAGPRDCPNMTHWKRGRPASALDSPTTQTGRSPPQAVR